MPPTWNGPGARGSAEAGSVIAGRRHIPVSTTPNTAPTGRLDQRELRFRHNVERLHRLGSRAVYELLAELGARRLLRTEIEQLVGAYADLDPDIVRAVGTDRLPPLPPLRLVRP